VGHVAIVDNTSVICRCGNPGCLEALAGGALARDGSIAASSGRSPYLAQLLNNDQPIQARDVARASRREPPNRVVGARRAPYPSFRASWSLLRASALSARMDRWIDMDPWLRQLLA
jgi:hypothetical protein